MSELLHPVRLEWDGRHGLARADGVTVELLATPMPGWYEVHYTPGIQSEVRQSACDARRDMTEAEIAAVKAWLFNLAGRTRAQLVDIVISTGGLS